MSGDKIIAEARVVINECIERYGLNIDSNEFNEIVSESADTIKEVEFRKGVSRN